MFPALLGLVSCCVVPLPAQTTQGLISGRILNSVTGRPVANAAVHFTGVTGADGSSLSDSDGYYYLLLLSPGIYRVQVTAGKFQSQDVEELELRVASRIELDFRLRPLSDVWESGQYNSVFLPGSKTVVTFFGPDVDPSRSGSFEAARGKSGTLESTVSQVIDNQEINDLPLAGRDVYTMLMTLPGVTSDSATGRGLGLSINGQRPSSSNYLLDGVENNNYLTTGPLTTVAPEAIEEYRVSTNNFSAEYGRTAGFVANAITRAGGNQFHGLGYFYFMNDALNANGFQENLNGFRRNPDKQIQPGFVVTGPVLHNRLYFSSSYEYFRNRSAQDPTPFTFPATPSIYDPATWYYPSAHQGWDLLQQYRPPAAAGDGSFAMLMLSPPVEVDRQIGIQRFEYSPAGGKDKWMARLMGSFVTEPDFIWTPYPDFISPLHQNTGAVAVTGTHTFRPDLVNEIRGSFSVDDLHWIRPHSEIPTLLDTHDNVTLPGSPAFYGYRNVNPTGEFLDNVLWAHGRHMIKAGAGVLLRGSSGYLTAGRDGEYLFDNLLSFFAGQPSQVNAAVSRTSLPGIAAPNFNRSYGYRQYYGFAQETYKVSSRLTVNYGLRYELYGSPQNTGSAKDALVSLGPGATLADQLTGATLTAGGSGDQTLFGTDKNDWGVRAGAAYDVFGNGRTVVRGGFGTFYDRPFDNLWENLRNNSITLLDHPIPFGTTVDFLQPVDSAFAGIQGKPINTGFPDLTLVDPHLRNGLVKSYFTGVVHQFSDALTLEVDGLGSNGTHLITTDIVNRGFSTTTNVAGRYNPALPDIAYRSGQGSSNYNALATVLRYRTSRGLLQATYTWSHAIDNQSDPLLGDFFNLSFANVLSSESTSSGKAAFSRQFNPNADRGNADFDQRHNLVLVAYWNVPQPFGESKFGFVTRGWNVSALAAFRSGLPYTVFGSTDAIDGQGLVLDNRANVVDPSQAVLPQAQPVTGGKQLLNAAGFTNPAISTLGNTGRNAFAGPGFYSLDFSLARSFALRWLGDEGRVTFRASAFNLLNHANLNNPDTQLNDPAFGIALYGRQGTSNGFPAVAPLNETPRQVQLSLRIAF